MVEREAVVGTIFMADGFDSPEIRVATEPRLIDTVSADILTIGALEKLNPELSKKIYGTIERNVGKIQENPEIVDTISSSLDRLVAQVKTRVQPQEGPNANWYECNDLINDLQLLATPQPEMSPLQESTAILAQKKLADIALTYEQVPDRGETLPEQAEKNFKKIAVSTETIKYLTEKDEKAWKLAIDTIDLHRDIVKKLAKSENGSLSFSIEPAYEGLLAAIFSTQNEATESPNTHTLRVKAASQFSTLLEAAPTAFTKNTVHTIRAYLNEHVIKACEELAPGTPKFREMVDKFIAQNKEKIYRKVQPSTPDPKSTDIPQASTIKSSIEPLSVSTPEGVDLVGNKEAITLKAVESALRQIDPSIELSQSVNNYLGEGPTKPGILDMIRQRSKAESVDPTIQALEEDRARLTEKERLKALAEDEAKKKARQKEEKEREEQRNEALTFETVEQILGQFKLDNVSESEATALAKALTAKAEQLRLAKNKL